MAARATRLTLCIATGVLTWLAAEAVVALCFDAAVDFHTRGPRLQVVLKPDPRVVPGMDAQARYTTNSRGVRGPEFPPNQSAYRILCVGGSTTECNYLDDRDTWYGLLMHRLNAQPGMQAVWAGGVGFSGYTTQEHIRFIRDSNLIQEVDCLIALVGINDFQWFLAPPERQWDLRPEPLWRRSGILNRARAIGRRLIHTPNIAVDDSAGEVYTQRRQRRRQMQVVTTLPDITEALRNYKQRIRSMVDLAKDRNVRLVFATQPVVWRDNLSDAARSRLWFGWMGNGQCLSVDQLRHGMDRFNHALMSTCDEMGIPYIDLSPLHGNEALFIDDCHFNKAGARALADVMAAWFLDHRHDHSWLGPPQP